MRKICWAVSVLLFTPSFLAQASDVNVRVILSGEVAPGVYGRVEIGNSAPPPVVYVKPVVIAPAPVEARPVYLHVPPGHAKHWSKHCKKYDACGVPVYFVKSAEYEPKKKKDKKEKPA